VPKQYDQAFKLLTEDDPRATLALFARIPLTAKLTVEPLDRELNLPTLHADNLFRCRSGKTDFIVHFEAVARFKRAVLEKQFDYVQAIVAKYKLPCRSFLVLLTEKGVPEKLPRALYRKNGDYSATLRLHVVRLWRISATRILRMRNPQLLPWTPLLDSSPTDLRVAFEELEAADEDVLTTRLFLLGGLRYGSREAFLQKLNQMILSEEVLKESSTYRYLINKGRRHGLDEGFRKALTVLLKHRFGVIPTSARTKLRAASRETLDRWLEQVLDAPTLKDALK
jgi:hypothetical protein